MPTITADVASLSEVQRGSKICSDSMENILLKNGFHTIGKTSNGCFIRKVAAKNTEIPQLIRDLFPSDNQDDVWILSNGYKDHRINMGKKENEEEEVERLANLGTI